MELHEEGILSHDEMDGLDLHFGDADAMVEMVHRIAKREGRLGELGGLGEELAAKRIGRGAENYITTIKGMGTIGTDPRVAKGFGFGFVVASRGSDHLRAHPVFEMIKYPPGVAEELFGAKEAGELSKYEGKVRLVFFHENMAAVTDSMGTCRFMHASFYAEYPIPEILAKHLRRKGPVYSIKYHEWLSAATGLSFTYDDLMKAGQRIVNLERALNVRFGVRREHDTLPKRFLTQPVPTGPFKGAVFSKEKLDEMLDEYYELRGWERETGLPYRETLIELGLSDVAEDLEQRGLVATRIKEPSSQ